MGDNCTCKIDRISEEYDLTELDEELYDQHQESGASLRDLEAYVNRRILEHALEDAEVIPLGGVESIYEILDSDDVSAGKQAELRARLTQAGIDIEQVERDFVTYQTVRKHLRQALDLDTGKRQTTDIDDAETTIRRLRSKSETVIAETLNRLRKAGKLNTDELDIMVSIRVTCKGCGDSYPLHNLLDRGKCQCGGNADI